jgi:hypothetical protein
MQSEQPDRDEAFLDELLAAAPGVGNLSLRESLLRRTSIHLRRRRLVRTAAKVGLLATCFAGGMVTMALVPNEPAQVVVVTTIAAPNKPDAPPAPERRLTPAQIEIEAELATLKAESARRFREAGDQYLQDEGNYAAAVRCYRNFLDEADAADLVSTSSDTWLLASLKNARTKETN